MELAVKNTGTLSSSTKGRARVEELENHLLNFEQYQIPIEESLHGGMYARTARLPPNILASGVVVNEDTLLIVNGACRIYDGDVARHYDGYNVIKGAKGRKCAILTLTPVQVTTLMPTTACTLDEAIQAYTSEYERLQTASRRQLEENQR